MAKIPIFEEKGTSGVQQWAGRLQERYLASLQVAAGIAKMAEILHKEPAAFTAHRMMLLTGGRSMWSAFPASDKNAADQKAADFLAENLEDMSHHLSKSINFAMSAQAFGFSDLEIVMKRRDGPEPSGNRATSKYSDGLVGLRKLGPRRQETVDHWKQDPAGGYQEMVQIDPNTYTEIPIPIEKLLHFIGGDDRGSW